VSKTDPKPDWALYADRLTSEAQPDGTCTHEWEFRHKPNGMPVACCVQCSTTACLVHWRPKLKDGEYADLANELLGWVIAKKLAPHTAGSVFAMILHAAVGPDCAHDLIDGIERARASGALYHDGPPPPVPKGGKL